MKPVKSTRILIFLVILSIALSVGFAVLLVRQEMERRRSAIEFQVYKIMTGLVDVYNAGGMLDPSLWPELSGFGIYSATGLSVYRYGTAPKVLEAYESVSSRGSTALTGSSMTILRRSGPMPAMRAGEEGKDSRPMQQMMGGGQGRRKALDGTRMLPLPANPLLSPGRENRFVFIDINVENLLREGRLVFFAVLALLSVFITIVSLVIVYSRRIAAYRDREQNTAHLVQLGEAARTLAHEIKNPLGVMRVQCATLRRTLPEERVKNISVIEEEIERLVQLTNRVRDFLHKSEGNPRVCEASLFLEQCRVRYTTHLNVVPWTGPALHVRVDSSRMLQVLDNLIANAIEASADSPGADLPELSLQALRNKAAFQVADRGSGVSPENRGRLFEPFFTTKARGSGIGLALARRFMEQAGGSLGYEERPLGGSVFTAVLPCVKKKRED